MRWTVLWDRLWGRFLGWGHRRRIRQARRVLTKIRPWLATNTGAARVFGYLRKIDPLTFEELVLEAFVQSGLRVRRSRRYSGDGGIDGYVALNGRWIPIQCKRYANAINPQHVRAFVCLVQSQRSGMGFFIHTGRTGPQSREAIIVAQGCVTMISGQRLIALLSGDRPSLV
ncbi:MAG: restriction endonuclease [Acidiferrobacter sp.]